MQGGITGEGTKTREEIRIPPIIVNTRRNDSNPKSQTWHEKKGMEEGKKRGSKIKQRKILQPKNNSTEYWMYRRQGKGPKSREFRRTKAIPEKAPNVQKLGMKALSQTRYRYCKKIMGSQVHLLRSTATFSTRGTTAQRTSAR